MNRFIFTHFAKKQFQTYENKVQEKIIQKLKILKQHDYIFSVLKTLVDFEPATHRLRIGDYRLILKWEKPNTFLILAVGHRKNIYK